MANKNIETRGRKKLPKEDKLHPITIRVKYKFLEIATAKAIAVEVRYR